MPPKKGASKKTENNAKKKAIEDKTFGLKNKNKSAKVNRYVQQVEKQVMSGGSQKSRKADAEKESLEQRKKEEKKKQEEFAEMFKPVAVQQKVPFGVDPKTILCEFFKVGACKKGDKCKFSHNMAVDRKGSKMDVYTDKRDQEKLEDTMDTWDQSRLEQVVTSKHGNPQTTTSIVCKFFLEAIESGKYGWFWDCPNGGDKCKYKHALPPGFVLKKDKKPEEVSEISLEEFLETERHKLGSNQTPVTLESFTKWKIERKARKEAEEQEARQAKERAFKAGKMGNMSGRDFFEFNPEIQNAGDDNDDDGTFDFAQYRNTDGGYQQDSQYTDQQGEAQGETQAASESLGDLKISDDKA